MIEAGPARTKKLIRRLVRGRTDYEQSPQRLEQVRREIAQALARR